MNFQRRLTVAVALLVVAGAPPVFAQAEGDVEPTYFVTAEDKWSFEITPYAWLPGIKADVTVRNHTVDVDQSFSDIFKSVKFAAAGLAIARYQNWLIWTQVDYFSLSTDQLNNPPARGSLDSKETLYTVAGGYRFNGWSDRQSFDVMIGAQGIHFDDTLTLNRIGSFEKTRDVVVPVLIVRPNFRLSTRWVFNPTLSFGESSSSKTTYQLQPQFVYQFNRTWQARFGYRKLYYKITSDRNNTFDGSLTGPLIGFGATF
jgi:hypothetical protein